VTRLGEFSPIACLIILGSFFEIITEVAEMFGLLSSKVVLPKKEFGCILGDFFSQSHLVTLLSPPTFNFQSDIITHSASQFGTRVGEDFQTKKT
jgi:hypothetical protein